ncbi:hypothetical protein ACWD25_04045 [Streptomyces sp. NPDC002920]
MRRTAILLLAACLTLAGCSSGGEESDAKPSSSPSPTADPGEVFVASVIDAHLDSYAAGVPAAAELQVFPPEWCQALDDGHSAEWMFAMEQGGLYPVGEEWGTEKADAYQVLVLGVKAYCPKHSSALLAELRDAGLY